jgi:hypothetical protein
VSTLCQQATGFLARVARVAILAIFRDVDLVGDRFGFHPNGSEVRNPSRSANQIWFTNRLPFAVIHCQRRANTTMFTRLGSSAWRVGRQAERMSIFGTAGCKGANRIVAAMGALLSEGKGHTFESCRVRQ